MIDEKKLIKALIEDEKSLFSEVFCYIETKWRGYTLKNLARFINKQPKAGEWIPCSERLPEEDEDVLVCIIDEHKNYYHTVTHHHIVWQTEVGGMFSEVIAWMPLPEPYKKEEP